MKIGKLRYCIGGLVGLPMVLAAQIRMFADIDFIVWMVVWFRKGAYRIQ